MYAMISLVRTYLRINESTRGGSQASTFDSINYRMPSVERNHPQLLQQKALAPFASKFRVTLWKIRNEG